MALAEQPRVKEPGAGPDAGGRRKALILGTLCAAAKALKDLSSATKTNMDVAALRRKIQAETKQVATDVEKTARQAGLTEDQVTAIRKRILGIGEQQ